MGRHITAGNEVPKCKMSGMGMSLICLGNRERPGCPQLVTHQARPAEEREISQGLDDLKSLGFILISMETPGSF